MSSGATRRQDVVDALRNHGVSGAAAARAWDEARRLIAATRRRSIEHAMMFDAETGDPVGGSLTGTRSSTDLRAHIARFQAGREYFQIHTHPGSTSFSPNDVLVLATQPAIRAMAVVGVDRTWHIVSYLVERPPASRRDVVDAFIEELARLEAEGVEFERRPHKAMLEVAARHGVRYDRIGGP